MQTQSEAHTRIIWCCSWTNNDRFFATGSRDKNIKFWGKKVDKCEELGCYGFENPVTAINFSPIENKSSNVFSLFVGFESGDISVCRISIDEKFNLLYENLLNVNKYLCHSLTVKRIKSVIKDDLLIIATCSDDHSVRIFDIKKQEFE